MDRFLAICAKWEVPATVIGEVTDTGRLEMTWHGEPVVDIPPGSAADDGPVYDRPGAPARRARTRWPPTTRPGWPGPAGAAELRAALLAVLAAPDAADKTWVTEQYDRYVRGDTVLAMPHDAGADPDRRGRPASASPWPPTATAGTACSTRTPAPSWRWPRPTATWPPPAPGRWP